jgi:hypothetical protein
MGTIFASGHEGRSMNDVYILRSPGKTVIVSPAAKNLSEGVIYMRMPDLNLRSDSLVVDHKDRKIQHSQHSLDAPHIAFQDDGRLKHEKQLSSSTHGASPGRALSRSNAAKQVDRQNPSWGKEQAQSGRLIFGAEKIKGTVRLPRVKFARVGIPMELRDETPSLDFTEKTLKDSGF